MLLTHVLPSSPVIMKSGRRNPGFTASRVSPRLRRWLEGISLWLAVLLFLFVQPLYAEASETGPEGTGGFHFIDNAGQHQASATLLDTDYRVTVSGLIADTRLRQSFRNTSQQWREGVFVFPLPENASVYGMTLTAGERVIVGEVHEKEETKRQYTKAKKEGRKVARVDQQRPNLFTTRMANIPPGETIVVELSYQQAVRYQSGEFELRLPTTLTPRYMPGQAADNRPAQWTGGWAMPTTEVADADQISPFTVLPEDVGPDSHRASITLNINAGLPVSRVSSPSHRITSTWNGNAVEVAPESDAVLMDRDLVVRWAPARGMEPAAAVFHEQWQGEDYLLALMVPGLNRDQQLPRELVFVIDTSGSMAGESIRQARQALLRGLETVGPEDRFNVIQFSSQTHALFMESVPASANNIARARRYVQDLNANGGTEMASALDAALDDRHSGDEESPARVRQVVFITDGSVGNEAALFGRISSQLGRSRLFTVGIGSAPNMHFMREAARYGRGTYTAISDLSDVERPLDELFGKMESPVLTDITVNWPGQTSATEAFPGRIGDLFRGEPMVQVVRGLPDEGELEVSGRLPDGSQWQQSLRLDQAAPGKGLHRHWATQKINGLMDSGLTGQINDDARGEVTDLALKHQLMTKYTSFLAQEKTPSRPAGETLATDSVPTLLPAGGQGTMLRYPQTATLSPLLIAIGLVGLMFSAAITLLQRRVFA
ncbi:marine proteobacterial sortase target protein [Marinobacter panjinensis]|uniref:Marine proteobacterial sortase target protein n=1 Tax=Marinobacter panjinensis TaxID=2576384 RepID=A0A4U6R575_9GAMM|nr:marine proteobacterial sortase target protein [Marinobacter panjinensis]MCR8914511.1 marine proteobacterial sortase target protein [Marinobacter panjinensis]TKV68661.1 marine proteobacterial sortase target protein [Marinobacter panjinensis]